MPAGDTTMAERVGREQGSNMDFLRRTVMGSPPEAEPCRRAQRGRLHRGRRV